MVEYQLEQPVRKQRRRIFRENYHLESDDLMYDLPFQGQPSKSCGQMKKPRKHENSEFHPKGSVLRTKTIHCHEADCPRCNILWTDLRNRIPYLFGDKLVPDGWWGYSVESVVKRMEFFQGMINDELDEIRESSGQFHNFKDDGSNNAIYGIIRDFFPKSIPRCRKKKECHKPDYCSYHKLHNILWHMLKTGEPLRIYHIVMSPPQGQDYVSQFARNRLKAKATNLFIKSGGWGGAMAMHHVRIVDKFNSPASLAFKGMVREDDAEGFHFHVLGFGFLEYDEWEKSGWVVKNLSYNEEKHRCYPVESVRGAMEYILEHCAIASKKEKDQGGSLSCEKAFLTASTASNDPYESIDEPPLSISYSFDTTFPESETDSETAEIQPPQSTVESGISGTAKKLRKYDAYWYVGCLAKKNFKVPKNRPICPVGDHEIEKGAEKPFDIYVNEPVTVGPEYVSNLEFYKSLEIGESEKVDHDIALAKANQLKIWMETKIEPSDFGKYFQRIYTKSDNILNMVEGGSEFASKIPDWLYESCKRRRLSDPDYKWWFLPHSSYVTDIMDTNSHTTAKFRMVTVWEWE